MSRFPKLLTTLSTTMVVLLSLSPLVLPAGANVLQGNVEEEDVNPRLNRPINGAAGNQSNQGGTLRIQRPSMGVSGDGLKGMVDTGAFSKPLSGGASDTGGKLGLLEPAQFDSIPNSKFDLGAERNSRELTLAWEAWHHQLSREIYKRWSDVAMLPGQATLRITVTRDRQIIPSMLHSSGNPMFDRVLLETVMSLNNNPGLTFPAKSERPQVAFEADYVAATDIQAGYSWVKNDYEHVHQNY